MTEAPSKRRRWFRFSLRALFVVVTLLGVWLGNEVSVANNRRAIRRQIEQQGGTFPLLYNGHDMYTLKSLRPATTVRRVSFVRRWLGDRPEPHIAYERPLTDADRVAVSGFPEAKVYFRGPSRLPKPGNWTADDSPATQGGGP
jgi:hypothetical protein